MVSFGTQNETLQWSHFCGGSIISNHTIISAAHCFYSSRAGGYKMGTKIRLGDANLNDAMGKIPTFCPIQKSNSWLAL